MTHQILTVVPSDNHEPRIYTIRFMHGVCVPASEEKTNKAISIMFMRGSCLSADEFEADVTLDLRVRFLAFFFIWGFSFFVTSL